jgi:hypothetical protein
MSEYKKIFWKREEDFPSSINDDEKELNFLIQESKKLSKERDKMMIRQYYRKMNSRRKKLNSLVDKELRQCCGTSHRELQNKINYCKSPICSNKPSKEDLEALRNCIFYREEMSNAYTKVLNPKKMNQIEKIIYINHLNEIENLKNREEKCKLKLERFQSF